MRAGSSGRASFPVVLGGAVLAITAALVLTTYLRERAAKRGQGSTPTTSFRARVQAADERRTEVSREKYRRELRFCEAFRIYEGAEVPCLADFAVEHKDVFFCEEIPVASRGECFRRVAKATGEARLCENETVPEWQRDCYLDAVAVSGDAAACDAILRTAAATGDAEITQQRHKACLAVARGEPAACEMVSETASRRACFQRLAVRTRNPGLCENVRDRQLGDMFQHQLYNCWQEVAVAAGREEDCDRIPHPGINVNMSGTHAWAECRDRISLRDAGAGCREGRRDRDLTCTGKIAAAKNDFKLCQKGRSYTDIDLCSLTFAFRKNDASACASISEKRLQSACLEITGGARDIAPRSETPVQPNREQ